MQWWNRACTIPVHHTGFETVQLHILLCIFEAHELHHIPQSLLSLYASFWSAIHNLHIWTSNDRALWARVQKCTNNQGDTLSSQKPWRMPFCSDVQQSHHAQPQMQDCLIHREAFIADSAAFSILYWTCIKLSQFFIVHNEIYSLMCDRCFCILQMLSCMIALPKGRVAAL